MRIGDARVSTDDQSLNLQLDALKKAGGKRSLTDKLSAAKGDRPGLADAVSHIRSGNVLRLSTPGATLSAVSANRHAEPRHLERAVQGELDWIVMKALEKDRRRRYETANDFAADVLRHLTDEPVEACPPSAGYRLVKYVRRHRSALTTVLLLAAALVGGTAVSAWQAVRATAPQGRAEDHLTMGLRAVDELYDQVAARWLSDLRWGPLPRPFLEKVLPFHEKFSEGPRVDPSVGRAHRRIGEILIQLERYKGAGEALLRAEAIGQAFLAVDPENPEHRRDLAACYAAQGELPQEWATRLRVHQKAIALREGLADRFPGVPLYRKELAAGHQTLRTWYNFSRQAGADEHLGRAREIRERLSAENPADPDRLCDLGVTLRGLSEVRGFAGLHGDAEPYSRRALAIHDGLLARDPTRPRFWLQLAWDCVNLGHVLEHTRQYGEAGRVSGRAATMFEGLVSDYPDVSTYRENLAESLCVKVNALNQTGDCAEAERIIARLEKLGDARGISRRLADMAWHLVQRDAPRANPPAYAVELATRTRTRQPDSVFASHVLGMAYYRVGNWDAAIEALGRANALEHDEGFAFNGFFVAMAEHRKGDHEQARSWYDRSVAWMAENKPKDRDASRYRDEAAALLGMKTKQAGTASKPPAAPKRPPD